VLRCQVRAHDADHAPQFGT
jgi:hypothetical protein